MHRYDPVTISLNRTRYESALNNAIEGKREEAIKALENLRSRDDLLRYRQELIFKLLFALKSAGTFDIKSFLLKSCFQLDQYHRLNMWHMNPPEWAEFVYWRDYAEAMMLKVNRKEWRTMLDGTSHRVHDFVAAMSQEKWNDAGKSTDTRHDAESARILYLEDALS